MKFLTFSIIGLFIAVFILTCIPEASAKHHCRSRTSVGFSVNMGSPGYVVAPAPVVVAVPPVYPPPPAVYTYATPYPCATYTTYATYPYYSAPVVVERPAAYVQPGFSYSYRRY